MARSTTTYRSKWKSGATTVIRVPSNLAPTILEYARELDAKSEPSELREPEMPYRTANDVKSNEPVNRLALVSRNACPPHP